MENLKFYVSNMEDLNEYEREHNKISYRRLIERVGDIWLFNNAPKLCDYDFEFELGTDYDEETDEYYDIYQYYLINTNDYRLQKLKDINCNDLIIAWSNTLEEYVLMVTHFGTSWDYVLTDFEPTTDYNKADF